MLVHHLTKESHVAQKLFCASPPPLQIKICFPSWKIKEKIEKRKEISGNVKENMELGNERIKYIKPFPIYFFFGGGGVCDRIGMFDLNTSLLK